MMYFFLSLHKISLRKIIPIITIIEDWNQHLVSTLKIGHFMNFSTVFQLNDKNEEIIVKSSTEIGIQHVVILFLFFCVYMHD
jgi:hypothetical protein